MVGDELPGSREKDFEFYPKTTKDLIERYRIVVFFQGRPTHVILRSKTRIVAKSKARNVSPNVARSGSAGEIAIGEIAARVAVTGIPCGNVELLLALETPVKKRKTVNRNIFGCIVRHIRKLGEVIKLPQNSAAIPLAISHKSDHRRLVLS